jgi:pimeloyl-ACP methyl ester carboxylesterase
MNDRMLPFMRYGAPMLVAVPQAELKLLPGVGHVPMIDDPILIANTILDFVESTAMA